MGTLNNYCGAGVGFAGLKHKKMATIGSGSFGVFAAQRVSNRSEPVSHGHSELGLKKEKVESFPPLQQQPLELELEAGRGKGETSELEMERIRRQPMKRSAMIAKQVITIQSALSLGFVSQLWVHIPSWTVLVVEVRPSLLSGEIERFYLEDVFKVGDVILLEDESVLENDFNLLGMETLVGYTVVTPGQRSIGKVRGYTFDLNSGAVESLELDSFGMSIIPSSLVSTYGLYVEDVVEVSGDTVVVHEAAASRIQRLTKGIWGASEKKMGRSRYPSDEGNVEEAGIRAMKGMWKKEGEGREKCTVGKGKSLEEMKIGSSPWTTFPKYF